MYLPKPPMSPKFPPLKRAAGTGFSSPCWFSDDEFHGCRNRLWSVSTQLGGKPLGKHVRGSRPAHRYRGLCLPDAWACLLWSLCAVPHLRLYPVLSTLQASACKCSRPVDRVPVVTEQLQLGTRIGTWMTIMTKSTCHFHRTKSIRKKIIGSVLLRS